MLASSAVGGFSGQGAGKRVNFNSQKRRRDVEVGGFPIQTQRSETILNLLCSNICAMEEGRGWFLVKRVAWRNFLTGDHLARVVSLPIKVALSSETFLGNLVDGSISNMTGWYPRSTK